ncbi:unnamed protein product [Miscanthus lutarioriparius]|uniref:PGG domain-containing protein n=1 Tax=Miscanthus lutarioriparius TaxID=422564 RepID=A0A811Q1W3_9POAL|nr:unnamed protein product [Miscanthus lutarioriparius]
MADPGGDAPPPASTEYLLKKYLLLLATLVATVTYVAGLNLPGGSWLVDDASAGEVAGDSILRETNYWRYILFYYFNAISFSASLLLGLLVLLLQKEGSRGYLLRMWTVMLVDGLSLMGAYAAGISHDRFTTICASVLVSGAAAYGAIAFATYVVRRNKTTTEKLEKKHEILLVLAIFGATIAYVAGMNPPGGFWRNTVEGHHAAGDPVLQHLHPHRYKAFFFCNTTAFVASLLAIMIVVDHEKLDTTLRNSRLVTLYGFIILALLGLGGSYAAGSCRDGTHTALVVALGIPVVVLMCLQHALQHRMQALVKYSSKLGPFSWIADKTQDLDKTREYIQLLATLVATVAYTAGLDPPGGVWAANGEGHNVGDPILLTTHPGRYKVFFYFNSAAFVASLVIIVMLQSAKLVRGHALEAALILDFFGLIGAYAAGSSRDTSTSIYTLAIAGGVLIYVVIHIAFCTLEPSSKPTAARSSDEDHKRYEAKKNANLKKKREMLLLLAILAATLAYQAGLTPPGGLWEEDDDRLRHRAGFPVLQDKYPRRYMAFFYCNAASFMASMALIILLLNENLYKPGIRCYALYVCMVVGMFALMGAYAAGSSLHLRTSIIFLASVAAGIAIVIGVAINRYRHQGQEQESPFSKNDDEENKTKEDEEDMAYYLMLVGILAASVTYLTGLKPPGGMWRDDGDGHSAGNPVLYDTNKRRYNVFFYSNSTSFMASIMVIALLLSRMMLPQISSLRRVHAAVVMDVLALLVAYAAGSSRESRRSWKVIMLFPIVVFVVFLFYISMKRQRSPPPPPPITAPQITQSV